MREYSLKQKLLAEFTGTFLLVFPGCFFSVFFYEYNLHAYEKFVPLIVGFTISLSIYLFRNISGANINPAISVAFVIFGNLKKEYLYSYIIMQLLGASFASFIIFIIFPNVETFGAIKVSSSFLEVFSNGLLFAFLLETLLTFILLSSIFILIKYKNLNTFAPTIVGVVIVIIFYFVTPWTGFSMNPARTFAPAIFENYFQHIWIFLLAPFLGATISAIIFKKKTVL